MKLKKRNLLDKTRDTLINCGYSETNDTFFGADGLFIKRISGDFFLSLGLVISQLYDLKFTASYYLSKTTRWGSVWGDIPRESYKRVGYFLTQEERIQLLPEEDDNEGVRDAWWNGIDKKSIDNFIITIQITEKRFLEQPDLFKKIEESVEIKELVEYAEIVNRNVTIKTLDESSFRFVPLKPINNIPIDWFKAAELAISEKGGVLNANTVKLLAADAYYQYLLKQTVQISN
jgi:hypothetical protein